MAAGRFISHLLRMLRSCHHRRWQMWSKRQPLYGVLAVSLTLTLSACVVRPPKSYQCNFSGDASRPTPPYSLSVTPPLAVDGVIYVGYTFPQRGEGYPGRYSIAALRASDGALLWRVVVGGGESFTTPLAVADGVLIVGGSSLVGLRASDGVILWSASLGAVVAVTASGGVLYAFSDTATAAIAALRLTDGHILWQTPVQEPTLPSLRQGLFQDAPLVAGNTVYLAVGNGAVEAIRADTGAALWTVSPNLTQSQQSQQPQRMWNIPFAISAGQLYVTTNGTLDVGPASVLRLNPATGESDGYALRLPETTQSSYPLLLAGGVYVVLTAPQPSPMITAYRLLVNGAPMLWRVSAPSNMLISPGSLMFADDAQTLYLVGSAEGTDQYEMIAAFRVSDGALLWSQRTLARSTPGIAATLGNVIEAAPGVTNPCSNPPIDQAAQIRALSSADGGIAWTRALTVAS